MAHNHIPNNETQVCCKIITVSDTRNWETDKSGSLMKERLLLEGHIVSDYEIVKDEKEDITTAVQSGLHNSDIDAVLLNGGTGIAMRDVTIESIQPLLQKELPGFGELFRYLSYTEDIGSSAILSRAIAGISKGKVIFSVPGSTGAVRLAMEKLILPELRHITAELNKDKR
ncbi:MogA/MoaB family molybdenum cofactor biosynthesis protein [Bacillus sp. P14.5]|uniref:MogA/MoaB family molybdenum cofactor biosynthesis protein n=1 Tax=Bacillus sp. P14.5 TaxID=1983400 RepID=UPI000DEBB79B|nr:MogA/MoaB family molybdenum cofactor biosynthesis protein [Bacillus sp. P14.5]